jgi:cytidylate kinase
VFIYAPEDEKIRRIRTLGKSEKEAVQLVEQVDAERAAFIRHYFGKEWPLRSLYNMMINSKFGDEHAVDTILQEIASLEARGAVPQAASR